MEKGVNDNPGNEEKDIKNKQKAGLNAIRQDDYVERSFKDMASDKKLSQTEMFEHMFWFFIKKERER